VENHQDPALRTDVPEPAKYPFLRRVSAGFVCQQLLMLAVNYGPKFIKRAVQYELQSTRTLAIPRGPAIMCRARDSAERASESSCVDVGVRF
jgi:hypothetical protein